MYVGLCFCQHFFDTYKDLTQVDPSKFAPYFELGYKQEQHEPTWFSASVVLHGKNTLYEIHSRA